MPQASSTYVPLDRSLRCVCLTVGNFRRGNNPGNHDGSAVQTRKISASVGDNLHLLQEEDDLDFIEDSWIGGALQ